VPQSPDFGLRLRRQFLTQDHVERETHTGGEGVQDEQAEQAKQIWRVASKTALRIDEKDSNTPQGDENGNDCSERVFRQVSPHAETSIYPYRQSTFGEESLAFGFFRAKPNLNPIKRVDCRQRDHRQ